MSSPVQQLQAINRKLGSFLLELTPDREDPKQAISSAEIAVLLSEVLVVSRLPEETGVVRNAAFELEWNEYRRNLGRLQGILSFLEERLRTERSVLESERTMILRANFKEKREG